MHTATTACTRQQALLQEAREIDVKRVLDVSQLVASARAAGVAAVNANSQGSPLLQPAAHVRAAAVQLHASRVWGAAGSVSHRVAPTRERQVVVFPRVVLSQQAVAERRRIPAPGARHGPPQSGDWRLITHNPASRPCPGDLPGEPSLHIQRKVKSQQLQ